jgi:signal transduction histidine kinase
LKTSKQIVDLVEKINDFIQAKESKLHLERFSLKEVMETIREENEATLQERSIQWIAPDDLPFIVADKMTVFRALRNLVGNARKYGGNGMRDLRFGYRHDERFHVISVSDDGVGLKDEDKEIVFDPFKRLETSRGQTGSGLGLAIVKEIAERHKGKTWVETGEERGATFLVSISKQMETVP